MSAPQISRAATAEVTMAIKFLFQSSRKHWIAFVTNVLPVPLDASKRDRQEGFEEWGWNGGEEGGEEGTDKKRVRLEGEREIEVSRALDDMTPGRIASTI